MKQRFLIEKNLMEQCDFVIGCDEVGRGALAGPVVAAAVVFNAPAPKLWWKQINDSKMLAADERTSLSALIKNHAVAWSIAEVPHDEIDRINIHHASLLAMRKAVNEIIAKLQGTHSILIDGRFAIPEIECAQQAIVNGDAKVHSIAAASIIAKVHRDSLMKDLEAKFPQYQFGTHKGYATPAHRKSIKEHGLSAIHRLSFCGNI